MKILLVHNRYQRVGGEDVVFETERDVLKAGGHEVATLEVSNARIGGSWTALAAAAGAVHSRQGRRLMREAIADARPDVVHVHNFFPLLSPSIFGACAGAGVPAVWTLHNFRVACANGFLLRNLKPCEACVGHVPWRAVQHRCYRGSRAGSAAVAAMIGIHRSIGTWQRYVARYIALTSFARDIFIRAGLPAARIAVKPNFIADPSGLIDPDATRKGFVFVGRLSPEKGISTLLEAWRDNPRPLAIVGDGPLAGEVAAAAALNPAIRYLGGGLSRSEMFATVAAAEALILPSVWYENFPLSLVEAMALATPVIASNLGALPDIVTDGMNGLLFPPGDAPALRRLTDDFAERDRSYKHVLGAHARGTYERALSPEVGLAALMDIYRSVVADHPAV